MLGNDVLGRTADRGWDSAEHLFFSLTSPDEEGFYYFRILNLTQNTDDFALAGTLTSVPEPASVVLFLTGLLVLLSYRSKTKVRLKLTSLLGLASRDHA